MAYREPPAFKPTTPPPTIRSIKTIRPKPAGISSSWPQSTTTMTGEQSTEITLMDDHPGMVS